MLCCVMLCYACWTFLPVGYVGQSVNVFDGWWCVLDGASGSGGEGKTKERDDWMDE